MPIVQQNFSPTTTLAGDIVNCVSQDVRAVLQTTSPDLAILLDYINRITNELMRFSRWTFLQADPQVFLTVPGITDYYIGVGTAPAGNVNTQLLLDDVFQIKRGDFIDRTQSLRLGKTDDPPVGHQFEFPGKPKLWRNSPSTPYTINIYPPPNENTYQFVPKACITSAGSGGSLPIRTYYLTTTFTDNCGGESTTSIEQVVKVPANMLLTVFSPVLPLTTDATNLLTSSGPNINGWNIYATSASAGGERFQASVALGTNWTEPSSGLTSTGGGAPGDNTLATLGGYIMEFNYYQTRQIITSVLQTIQIPDTYKDIVCAGVNWLAFKYLEMDDNAKVWKDVFEAGKVQMVKDANLHPRGEEFIHPDSAAITQDSVNNLGLDANIQWSLP